MQDLVSNVEVDSIPARLALTQEKSGVEVIDFKEHKDIVRRKLTPYELDTAID
jgi:hypothetical protein